MGKTDIKRAGEVGNGERKEGGMGKTRIKRESKETKEERGRNDKGWDKEWVVTKEETGKEWERIE